MALKLITAPADTPVTMERARAFLRAEDSESDDAVAIAVESATGHLEKVCGRAFCTQTWELTLDAFSDTIMLPLGPVQSIASIKYLDPDGNEQTLDPSVWQADLVSDPAWIVRRSAASWPSVLDAVNVVTIRFVAGWPAVPAPLQLAVLLLAGHWFHNREAAVSGAMIELPFGVENLIASYRSFLW